MTNNWKRRLMKEIAETCKSERDIHYLIDNHYLSIFFYTPHRVTRENLPQVLEFLKFSLTKGQSIKKLIKPSPDVPFYIGFQRIETGKPRKQRKLAIIVIKQDESDSDTFIANAYNAYYELGALLVGLSNLRHKSE